MYYITSGNGNGNFHFLQNGKKMEKMNRLSVYRLDSIIIIFPYFHRGVEIYGVEYSRGLGEKSTPSRKEKRGGWVEKWKKWKKVLQCSV